MNDFEAFEGWWLMLALLFIGHCMVSISSVLLPLWESLIVYFVCYWGNEWLSSIHPGVWVVRATVSRPRPPRPPPPALLVGPWGVPKQAERHNLTSMSRVCPEVCSQLVMPEAPHFRITMNRHLIVVGVCVLQSTWGILSGVNAPDRVSKGKLVPDKWLLQL